MTKHPDLFAKIVDIEKAEQIPPDDYEQLMRIIKYLSQTRTTDNLGFYFKIIQNKFKEIVDLTKLRDFIFNIIITRPINDTTFAEIFIENYKTIELFLLPEQQKKVESYYWRQIMPIIQNEHTSQEDKEWILNIVYPKSFNKKLINRLRFQLNPIDPEITKDYLSFLFRLDKGKPISHIEILSLIRESFTNWKNLQQIINKSTPAAKSLLRQVLFITQSKSEEFFVLDETLQPINAQYETISLSPDTVVKLFVNKLPPYIASVWKQYFNDNQIIPMFNYFG